MYGAIENFKKDGHLTHAAIMLDDAGTYRVGLLDYNNQAEKDIVCQELQKAVDEFKCVLLVQISEAWMNTPDESKEKEVFDAAARGELSKQAGTVEVIQVIVESKYIKDGGFTAIARIRREGSSSDIEEWKRYPLPTEGRFSRFLTTLH